VELISPCVALTPGDLVVTVGHSSLHATYVGHSNGSDITNRYSKVSENLEFRRTWAEKVGTGLDLSCATGDPPPQPRQSRKRKFATPHRPAQIRETAEVGTYPVAHEGAGFADVAAYVEPMFQASDSDLAPMFFEEPTPGPTQERIDAERARVEELRAILEGVN
jgi:hypothetical protein